MSIYIQEGYKSRRDYLDTLAADYGLDRFTVYGLAGILGPDEDFDGLICALQDAADELNEADE
jgi:hypothetical protein